MRHLRKKIPRRDRFLARRDLRAVSNSNNQKRPKRPKCPEVCALPCLSGVDCGYLGDGPTGKRACRRSLCTQNRVLAGAGRDFYPDRAARAGRAELFGDLGGARSTGIAPLPTVGMASPKKTEQ
jgi:hypothetical protein